jgi:hypothetical protein
MSARFVRHQPRAEVRGEALLLFRDETSAVGTLVDLSAEGAGVVIDREVRRGTKASLLVSAEALPEAPSLPGTIVSCVAQQGGFRVGLRFSSPHPEIAARLPIIEVRVTAERDDETPVGRERLFQSALAALAAGAIDLAADAARRAAVREPHNGHYRALMCITLAEQALAAGDLETARREAENARSLVPDARGLLALTARIEEAESHGRSWWARSIARWRRARRPPPT